MRYEYTDDFYKNTQQAGYDDNNSREFGSNRSHNRHFVKVTLCILLIAIAVLYIFNGFGMFGITASAAALTEDQCMQFFSQHTDMTSALFSEKNADSIAVKEAIVVSDTVMKFRITNDGKTLECYVKKQSDESLFKAKGLGSSDYKCSDSISVAYSGNFNGYYTVVREIQLPETLAIDVAQERPEQIGVDEFDASLAELPDKVSGTIEMPVDKRFIQEIVYTNSRLVYDKELADKRCMTASELLA